MKNTPHPDRTREAAQLRDELRDQPQALRSLDALAREESSDSDIPPIPDELRDQWQDRYGAARKPQPLEKESWLGKISRLWLYGGATALAALAIFVALRNDSPLSSGGNDSPPIMRGGNDFEMIEGHPIIFIPSDQISFASFAATRSENSTFEAKDIEEAVSFLTEKNIKSASILDGRNAVLVEWSGEAQKGMQILPVNSSTDEYDLSEALDEYLNR